MIQQNSKIISGISLREKIIPLLRNKAEKLKSMSIVAKLSIILVGNDPRSSLYVKNKKKFANSVGIEVEIIELPSDTEQIELIRIIDRLNHDNLCHGVLVQLPLPQHINELTILNMIHSFKDVDGLSQENVYGLISDNKNTVMPCTPKGCMSLIKSITENLEGKDALVIGKSRLVGMPMAHILMKNKCTVTIAHSRTKNLERICKENEIIVVATGNAHLIGKEHVHEKSIVIDVGITVTKEKEILGDVRFDEVKDIVRAITPVPGGVGPMTILSLTENVLEAACKLNNINAKDLK